MAEKQSPQYQELVRLITARKNESVAVVPAHAPTHEPGGSDPLTVDASPLVGSLRTLGAGANQAAAGDDPRLSDARTPTAHRITHEPGGSDPLTVDAAAAVGSLRTLGAGAAQACAGNDPRLSDTRTPSAHATSHQNGGSDEINVAGLSGQLADPQTPLAHSASHKHGGSDEVAVAVPAANAIPKAGAGGTIAIGFLATGVPNGTKFVRDDNTLAIPFATIDFAALTDYVPDDDDELLLNDVLPTPTPKKSKLKELVEGMGNNGVALAAPATGDKLLIVDVSSPVGSRGKYITLEDTLRVVNVLTVLSTVNADRYNDKILVYSSPLASPAAVVPENIGCALSNFNDANQGVASTAMTNSDLQVFVRAGETYTLELFLPFNYLTATGLKTDFGGTAVMSTFHCLGTQHSAIDGDIAVRVSTAMATDLTWGTLQTDTETYIRMTITCVVSSSGSLIFRFSRTGGAGTVTLKIGASVRAFNTPSV